jgi:hypothetical protein
MPNQNFWLSVKAMAAYLDGNWDLGELTLNQLHHDLMRLASEDRLEYRREIALIISQLSRLEIRLIQEGQEKNPTQLRWG